MGSSLPTQTANSQLKASSCYSREGTGQDSIQLNNQTLLSSFEASVSKTKQPTRTNQPLSLWPSQRSDRTTTRSAKRSSTSRSTWSSMRHTSIFPWPLTSPGMTSPARLRRPLQDRVRRGKSSWHEADGLPEPKRRKGRLPRHRQAQLDGVGITFGRDGGRP